MKEIYRNLNIIGADETGVGDYLSPLVACAAFVPNKHLKQLAEWGVKDSKKLSDKQINNLAQKIKPLVIHRLKHLSQKGYNKLNTSFNANELKMFLHMQAINDLETKITNADLIILDQFSTPSSIQKYYQKWGKSNFNFKPFQAKLKLVQKGESEHLSVAVASILARAFLIDYMEKQNHKWQTIFPLGTNAIVEKFTLDFVAKHGKAALNEVAKIKFKTTKKLFP